MSLVFQFGYHTEAAGTIITEVIPSVSGKIPCIKFLDYKTAGTAHTITIMRCVAATTAGAKAASGQAVLEFTDTGAMKDSNGADEVVAANDFIVYITDDGVYRVAQVSSVSGNDVTMTANLGGVVDAGSAIYIFGEVGRSVHVSLTTETSVVTEMRSVTIQGGIPGQLDQKNQRSGAGDPMIIHVDNVTAAGAIKYVSGCYVESNEVTMT